MLLKSTAGELLGIGMLSGLPMVLHIISQKISCALIDIIFLYIKWAVNSTPLPWRLAMKRIPKRYRKPQFQQPTIGLMGMTFKWNERVWTVTGYTGQVAFISSGNIKSQIELKMLPKVAEVINKVA